MRELVVDVDDFHQDNHGLELLDRIKREVPAFRATLFAVVGRCSQEFLDAEWRPRSSWLELACHGWIHETPRECETWDRSESSAYLDTVDDSWRSEYYVRGFRAPGWQISDEMYEELLARGWWVADQRHNNGRRPLGLRTYLHGPELGRFHYHVQDVCGNGLAESLSEILALAGEFRFVSEVV